MLAVLWHLVELQPAQNELLDGGLMSPLISVCAVCLAPRADGSGVLGRRMPPRKSAVRRAEGRCARAGCARCDRPGCVVQGQLHDPLGSGHWWSSSREGTAGPDGKITDEVELEVRARAAVRVGAEVQGMLTSPGPARSKREGGDQAGGLGRVRGHGGQMAGDSTEESVDKYKEKWRSSLTRREWRSSPPVRPWPRHRWRISAAARPGPRGQHVCAGPSRIDAAGLSGLRGGQRPGETAGKQPGDGLRSAAEDT